MSIFGVILLVGFAGIQVINELGRNVGRSMTPEERATVGIAN